MDADRRITQLIRELQDGNEAAQDELMPLVYEEMRRIAHRQLRGQRPDHTLSTTALVHEAYLKLMTREPVGWAGGTHFFALAARAMRQILIDYARRFSSGKRGGGWRRIPFDEAVLNVQEQSDMLLALDEALTRLAAVNERASRVVEYRFFGGLTESETAAALGVSERTIRRDWLKAKLWLYADLVDDRPV